MIPVAQDGAGLGTKHKHAEQSAVPITMPFPAAASDGGSGSGGGEAGWGPLGQKFAMEVPEFTGESGIQYHSTNWMGSAQKKQQKADMESPLHWFRMFFDND